MSYFDSDPAAEKNYHQFVEELTQISRKYGVALQVTGGVYIADDPAELAKLTYHADISSGDLRPDFHEDPDPVPAKKPGRGPGR